MAGLQGLKYWLQQLRVENETDEPIPDLKYKFTEPGKYFTEGPFTLTDCESDVTIGSVNFNRTVHI